jgi:ferritin
MLEQKIRDALNDQIKFELESAYLYFAMAAWLQSEDYAGMASWAQAQAVEEMGHVIKMQNYIMDRGGKITMQALGIKKTEWASPLEVFEDVLKHEQHVTGLINNLVELAYEIKDRPTRSFLEWFVNEQVEEVAATAKIVTEMRRIGDFGYGLVMLDRELGQRPVVPPTTQE